MSKRDLKSPVPIIESKTKPGGPHDRILAPQFRIRWDHPLDYRHLPRLHIGRHWIGQGGGVFQVSHSCASLLCETPHYENDDHAEECLCGLCHDHFRDWQIWESYPDHCEGCLNALSHWLHESTDLEGCQFPELCTYSKECQKPQGGSR